MRGPLKTRGYKVKLLNLGVALLVTTSALWLAQPAQAHKLPDSLCPVVSESQYCSWEGVCPKVKVLRPVIITHPCNNPSAGTGLGEGDGLPAQFSCDVKKNCGDMTSNDEALFYLNTCGKTRLDWDLDGEPCESNTY